MGERKIEYLQWLRVLATVGVVVIHLCAEPWYRAAADSAEWMALNVYDGLAHWPVPVFVMISGALFLGKERPLGRLYGTYILRIVTALVFWSGIYTLIAWSRGTRGIALAQEFLSGHYHLWYLYFVCGLYMISPFLGKIARDDRLCPYFLVLALIFGNVLPRLPELAALISPELGTLAEGLYGRVKLYFCMGYVFQFVLGYVLSVRELTAVQRRWIYALGLLGAAVTVLGTWGLSSWKGTAVGLLYEPQSLHVTAIAAAIFVFAKYHLTKLPRVLNGLAECSFGVYLSHAMVIEWLARRGIDALRGSPVWMVPVLAVVVTAVCWALTRVLRRIPGLGRYVT